MKRTWKQTILDSTILFKLLIQDLKSNPADNMLLCSVSNRSKCNTPYKKLIAIGNPIIKTPNLLKYFIIYTNPMDVTEYITARDNEYNKLLYVNRLSIGKCLNNIGADGSAPKQNTTDNPWIKQKT